MSSASAPAKRGVPLSLVLSGMFLVQAAVGVLGWLFHAFD
jgi:hypothetical protein